MTFYTEEGATWWLKDHELENIRALYEKHGVRNMYYKDRADGFVMRRLNLLAGPRHHKLWSSRNERRTNND